MFVILIISIVYNFSFFFCSTSAAGTFVIRALYKASKVSDFVKLAFCNVIVAEKQMQIVVIKRNNNYNIYIYIYIYFFFCLKFF